MIGLGWVACLGIRQCNYAGNCQHSAFALLLPCSHPAGTQLVQITTSRLSS